MFFIVFGEAFPSGAVPPKPILGTESSRQHSLALRRLNTGEKTHQSLAEVRAQMQRAKRASYSNVGKEDSSGYLVPDVHGIVNKPPVYDAPSALGAHKHSSRPRYTDVAPAPPVHRHLKPKPAPHVKPRSSAVAQNHEEYDSDDDIFEDPDKFVDEEVQKIVEDFKNKFIAEEKLYDNEFD